MTLTTQPRRRRDGAQRRNEILDAALHCFGRKGIWRVGIEEIRRAAGASPSSVYNLFADIDEIILALLIRVFERLFAHINDRVTRTRSAKRAVLALVEAHIDWIAENPEQGRFMYQAMAIDGCSLSDAARHRLAEAKASALAPTFAHVQKFTERGKIPPWPAALLDVVLLGPAHEGLRRWLAGAEDLHPVQLRETLPALAWRSIDG